jgi:hypothetical protein
MEAQKLKLPNENNCLACDAFIVINFAPKDPVKEEDLKRIYFINNEFNAQIVDLKILTFDQVNVCSHITLPATGLEAHEWRLLWKQKNPAIKPETKMCVYYYKKLK